MRAERLLSAQGRAALVSGGRSLAPRPHCSRAIEEVMTLPQPGSAATIMLDGAGVAARKIASAAARLRRSPTQAWDRARHAALDELRRGERAKSFAVWWRDDDVVAPSPALDRLLGLSARFDVPVALAAIPLLATQALARRLADEPRVDIIVHGLAHRNHSPPGQLSSELGSGQPLLDRMAALYGAHDRRLKRLFGAKVVAMLAPPWNRIGEDLVRAPRRGGLSAGALDLQTPACPRRRRQACSRSTPISTRCSGAAMAACATRRRCSTILAALARERRPARPADAREPIGLLTHHLEHDPLGLALRRGIARLPLEPRTAPCVFTRPAEFLVEGEPRRDIAAAATYRSIPRGYFRDWRH